MCVAAKSPNISPAPLPAEAPPAPTILDPEVKKAKKKNQQIAALASGRNSTILTGPQGLATTPASTTGKKTLLGQ